MRTCARNAVLLTLSLAFLAGCGSSSKAHRDEESTPDNDGPLAEVTLPVVVGLTETQAIAKLDTVDLIAVVEHVRSRTVATGRVIDQQPAAGNGEDPDSRILILVSSG